MPISDIERQKVSKALSSYAEEKIPTQVRDKLKLNHQWDESSVILFEQRPYFRDPTVWTETPIARFRYIVTREEWQLYCADRNSKWRRYDLIEPTKNFEVLLAEVDSDPTCIFWG